MIGKIAVVLLLAVIIAIWVSAMKSAIVDRYMGLTAKLFMSSVITLAGGAVFLFVFSQIPSSVTSSEIVDYKYVKNEEAAVYLYNEDYKHTTNAYLYQNAGDTSKVEVLELKWKNIRGSLVVTTIQVNQKE